MRATTTFLALAISLGAAPPGAAETERVRVGRAVDSATGVPLYSAVHRETVAGERVVADAVTYIGADDRKFAAKSVRFDGNPALPAFLLEDRRTGHVEGATPTAGGLEVRFRERRGTPLKRSVVEPPPVAVADAGFDRFIEARWDALVGGETVKVAFLVPSRLDFIDFRIRLVDAPEPGTVAFVMEVDSALLRLVVPAITVVYGRASRRLLRYEGLSNLRDESGDNPRVRIDFDYPVRQAAAGG